MAPKIIIPTSADELRDMLNDAKVYAKVYQDPDTRAEFQQKYAAAAMAKDPELAQQMREQVQLGLAEFMTSNGYARQNGNPLHRRPDADYGATKAVSHGRGAVYNKTAHGALFEQKHPAEDRFGSIGEYCQAIREEARPSSLHNRSELLRKLEVVRGFQNSFGSEDPGAGGFLIPEIMRSELLQLALESTIVRSRATVIPMSTLRVPIPTVDDTSHVSSLFGGVVFYWSEESASLTESQASFSRIVLDAKKLTGFFKVPNELLADAPAFSGWFDTRIPMGLAWAEDVAFLTETGTGTPEGFIGSPAYLKAGGGAAFARVTASHISYGDLVTMYSRMLPTSLSSAVWVMAINCFTDLAQMTLSSTAPGVWMGGFAAHDAADAPPVSIFGRPVFFTEKVPALGTSGDATFVDLSYYLIGDRQAVAVSASEHFAFQNDQTAYRIISRVDGRPWLQQALIPHNNGPTLSAYVGLP